MKSKKKPKTKLKNQSLKEVKAEISSLKSLEFESLQLHEQDSQLHLSSDINMKSLYQIFNLFISDKIFEKISNFINIYTQLYRNDDNEFSIFQDQL